MKPGHLLLAALIASVWGFNFYISKLGVNHVPPIFFGAYRYILVFVLLLPWLKPLKGQMGRVTVIALTSGALHFGFVLIGFNLTEHVGPVATPLPQRRPRRRRACAGSAPSSRRSCTGGRRCSPRRSSC